MSTPAHPASVVSAVHSLARVDLVPPPVVLSRCWDTAVNKTGGPASSPQCERMEGEGHWQRVAAQHLNPLHTSRDAGIEGVVMESKAHLPLQKPQATPAPPAPWQPGHEESLGLLSSCPSWIFISEATDTKKQTVGNLSWQQ